MNKESEYPVRFLQPEEIKTETVELLDNLEEGNDVISEVPLLPTAGSNACISTEVPNEEENERSSLTISLKILETEQQTQRFENCVPEELSTSCETYEDFVIYKNELICSKEKIAQLEADLACSSEMYKTLKELIAKLEADFALSKESSEKYKRKYRTLKEMSHQLEADLALSKESSEKYKTLKEVISQLEADLTCRKESSEKYERKYRTLKESIAQLEADLACSKESSEKYKRKYRTLKERIAQLESDLSCSKKNSEKYKGKYGTLKRKFNEKGSEDFQVLGSNTLISKEKLSICRTYNYSKYVGDIMEVLFGRETLASSAIREIKGVKKNALEPQVVKDIQEHVALKFQVPLQSVRAAMRQKLNTSFKRMKKNI